MTATTAEPKKKKKKKKDKKAKQQAERPTTRAGRKAKKPATVPTRFEPKFLDELDSRQGSVKKLRQQFDNLISDVNADSTQKRMLCEMATHLHAKISTEIVKAQQGQEVSWGSITQMMNGLNGLLSKLGLEKQAAAATEDLETYIDRNYGTDNDSE